MTKAQEHELKALRMREELLTTAIGNVLMHFLNEDGSSKIADLRESDPAAHVYVNKTQSCVPAEALLSLYHASLTKPLVCQVCEKELAVGVACVPGVPYSAAYGQACLARRADPLFIMRANVICCGGVAQTDKSYLQRMTFVDGEYMTLEKALAKHPITQEELEAVPGPYNVHDTKEGCATCGRGGLYEIVDPDGVTQSVMYVNREEAEHVCDNLNEAFARGQKK